MTNLVSKMMKFYSNVFRAGRLVIRFIGENDATSVVLVYDGRWLFCGCVLLGSEPRTLDSRAFVKVQVVSRGDWAVPEEFPKNGTQRNKLPRTCAEGNVFSLSRTEGNLCL